MLVRFSAEPVPADQDERDTARVDRLLDLLNEVRTGGYGVHVHEDPLGSETLRQTIMQGPRLTTRLTAPIADEHTPGTEAILRAVSHFVPCPGYGSRPGKRLSDGSCGWDSPGGGHPPVPQALRHPPA